ncbi:MAG TPA: nucleotidyltransferase domain-containing protein [Sulfurimonas sp.]|nr:nucleotidyltransferase domain-containing protein [Sulfurimonas sp.]
MLLRKKDRDTIIGIAKQTIHTPVRVLAYGSRVSGEAHDTSDLDLVLVTLDEKKINRYELAEFKTHLQDSNIPILTQVLDWQNIPESFHQNILKCHEELLAT